MFNIVPEWSTLGIQMNGQTDFSYSQAKIMAEKFGGHTYWDENIYAYCDWIDGQPLYYVRPVGFDWYFEDQQYIPWIAKILGLKKILT